jgi:hypothetical protein
MLRLIRHFLLVGLIAAGALRADEGVPQLVKTQGPKLSDLFGDEVIARGKGVEVKRSQLEDAFVAHKASLALRGQSIPEERRARLEAQLLQQLIVMQILTNRVTAADLKMANSLRSVSRKRKSSQFRRRRSIAN